MNADLASVGTIEGTHLDPDVLLLEPLALDDGLPDAAGAVDDDVRASRALERGEDEAETQPPGAEVHVELVCWGRREGWGDRGCVRQIRRVRGGVPGARARRGSHAPSGDLKTDARGLTSEMKFIIALRGSFRGTLPPSSAASLPLGSLLVRARLSVFRARPGVPFPARQRTGTTAWRARAEETFIGRFNRTSYASKVPPVRVVRGSCRPTAASVVVPIANAPRGRDV